MFIRKLFLGIVAAALCFNSQADQYLKQSTASQEVFFGPFVDDTDFKTAETALSIANTDIKCTKPGGTTETNKNSGGATHIANGRYYAVLDATDTNTLGSMRCSIKMTGALEVWEDIQVVSANYYDSTYGTTLQPVNVTTFGGTNRSVPELGIDDRGTASAASVNTVTLQTGHGFSNNTANGKTLRVWGTTAGTEPQERTVLSSSGDVFTLTTNLTETPTGTLSYTLFGTSANNFDVAAATIAKYETMVEADGGVFRLTANAVEQTPVGGSGDYTGSATAVGSTTSLVDTSLSYTLNDAAKDYEICFTSGLNAGMCRLVSASNFSTDGLTWQEALPNAVASGNAYTLAKSAAVRLVGATHTGAVIPTTTTVSGNVTGSVGSVAGNVTGNVTGSVGSVATGGIVAGSFAANAINAAAAAADLTTELQTGLSTAAALTTVSGKIDAVDDYVDTEVGAIKAKTDFLPSFTAGAAGGVFIAGTNAATTITTGLTTTFTGNLTGTVASVAGNVSGNVAGNVVGSVGTVNGLAANVITAAATAPDFTTEVEAGQATAASLAAVSAFVDTEVAAIKAVTDKVDTALVIDGAVYQLTSNALELGPTGSGPTAVAIANEVQTRTIAAVAVVNGLAANVLTAASAAADLTTELQTGLATAAALTTVSGLVDDLEARLGVPTNLGAGGATIVGNLVDIESQTDDIGAAGAGLTALATQASVNTVSGFVDTEVGAIKTKTDFLPSATAGAAGGLFIAGTNAATTANITGNLTGNVSGSVGSVATAGITAGSFAANALNAAAAAPDLTTELQAGLATSAALATTQADTDDLQARMPAALVGGRMDSSTGAMAANVMTAAAAAADLGTELQTGLSTSAALTTLSNTVGAAGAGLTATDDATLAAIAALNNLSQANVRTAVGLATANLDTQLAALPTAGANADAVWDESLAAHEGVVGSTAETLAQAGGAGASASDIATAVLDGVLASHVTAGTLGERVGRIPNAAAGANGGLPTVDASNRVAGIQGTLTTLDAVNTAQAALHTATLARLGTPAGASVSADVAAVKSDSVAILVDTGTTLDARIPAALVGGRMDSSTGAMAANVMTAAGAAPDLTTELQVGLATAAEVAAVSAFVDDIGVAGAGLTAADDAVMTRLGTPAGASVSADIAAVKADSAAILVDTGTTLDGYITTIDSLIDAIKAKTDQLTFGVTNQLDVNVESMNLIQVLGIGAPGNLWRGP